MNDVLKVQIGIERREIAPWETGVITSTSTISGEFIGLSDEEKNDLVSELQEIIEVYSEKAEKMKFDPNEGEE